MNNSVNDVMVVEGCVCAYTCIYMVEYVCVHTHAHIHRIRVCACVYMHVCVHMCIHTHMYSRI